MAVSGDGPQSEDDATTPHEADSGTKSPNVVQGAPFPPGHRQSDGPERRGRHVPSAPEPSEREDQEPDPRATEAEEDHGGT